MPLSRPALTLGRGPRGAQDARRWVVSTFEDIGRQDLVECAEMAVSELVTNAVLHAEPPIEVRVRGTVAQPRVEVRDGSPEPPALPSQPQPGSEDDLDDLLLTFGRGLTIVARAAAAWGAVLEDDGKVVWFVPAPEFNEGPGTVGLVTGVDPVPALGAHDGLDVALHDVPLAEYLDFQRQFRELRREVRLLALTADQPRARDLSAAFDLLGRPLTEGAVAQQLDRALEEHRTSLDLLVPVPMSSADLARLRTMLDVADEFCRQEKLLSLARTTEQRDFQEWLLAALEQQARLLAAERGAHGHAPPERLAR